MKLVIRTAIVAASLLAATAQAQVTVKDAWVRATRTATESHRRLHVQLKATKNNKLVSASSPLTPAVEVHEMAMRDNVMKMRQVPAVELPAGKTVELKPGGYHVMLMDRSGR
ncbi:Leucine-rich repeat-containing protein 18 [Manis javanica]|nr:Leucine-rich repeat-containing protein 18 [Manis javanica]